MADAPRRGGSFWATLPGVLTGIAAIITAVGALLGALVVSGLCRFQSGDRASLETTASIQSFGSVQVGLGSPASIVTVTNLGKAATRVTTTLEGGNTDDFRVAVDTCKNVSLPANTSCQVQLTFGPKSQGDKVATLRFQADNADPPPPLAFTGTGLGGALVSFDPAPVSISLAGLIARTPPTSGTKPLKITNTGTGDLRIGTVRTDDAGAHFSITADCDGRVLGPGQWCQVTVRFGTTTNGQFSAHALVFDNLATSPQSVTLSGYRGLLLIPVPTKAAQV